VTPATVSYVALLRGVNVGGNTRVAMADLRDVLSRLGFENARSLLQSGNVVFGAGERSTDGLERLLEREVAARFGMSIDVLVRTGDQIAAVVAGNPFKTEAQRDPGRLQVFFLKGAPGTAAVKGLQDAIVGREVARVRGNVAYIVYPDGMGRSRLASTLVERRLGVRATARNWNTVQKLHTMLTSPEGV